jgi:hypothetical protein
VFFSQSIRAKPFSHSREKSDFVSFVVLFGMWITSPVMGLGCSVSGK